VAWTSAFIDLLGRLGVEEKAARQALMRTAADGWLAAERVGRRTRWRLTENAERLLTEGTERIYGFTGSTTDWDGRWLLVLARVPETDRPARHRLRSQLTGAGLGSPSAGVWVSPHTEHVSEVERALREAGVFEDARLFVGEHVGGDRDTMIGQAWDLAALEQAYEQFRAEFAPTRAGDPLARLTELVHAWRRFPWIDPTLPAELLPGDWNGTKAVQQFGRRHAQWSAPARAEWERLNADG
jgi:phenylacetic acid degradation operon negative regulatory protein